MKLSITLEFQNNDTDIKKNTLACIKIQPKPNKNNIQSTHY